MPPSRPPHTTECIDAVLRRGNPYSSRAPSLSQTLVLGFNTLSDLSGLPWATLSALENLDLSSNRLRALGDVVLMTWLRRLNLENNEINPVPLELGLCTGGWGGVALYAFAVLWYNSTEAGVVGCSS